MGGSNNLTVDPNEKKFTVKNVSEWHEQMKIMQKKVGECWWELCPWKQKYLVKTQQREKNLMHKVKETGNNFGGNKHHWERIVLNKRWSCRLRKAWHNF